MKLKMRSIFQLAVATSIVVATLPSTAAQRPRDSARERESNERELELHIWNLRMISEQPRRPEKKRENVQQALAQMQEDFTRLQIVNRDLGRAAIKNEALDFKFVSKSVSDMRKYAQRLNANLALPEPEPGAERPTLVPATGPQQLKPAVLKLVKLVYRFVDNPFFKEASVVDTRLTSEARRDLEGIIELSEQIKKSGGKWDNAVREKP